ncbi:hypothetical protein PENTCL1PPCAC_18744, partial [Pristionchus entomophagus]
VTDWISFGFKTIIILPCVVVLITATVAFFAGSLLHCKKKSLPSRGCCSIGCTLITLNVIVLTISFIVMIPSSFVMTIGYGTQLVCQPFFYDDKLMALQVVDDLVGSFPVPSMTPNAPPVILKFSEMMLSCESKSTFMQAVKGDQIIDVDAITASI